VAGWAIKQIRQGPPPAAGKFASVGPLGMTCGQMWATCVIAASSSTAMLSSAVLASLPGCRWQMSFISALRCRKTLEINLFPEPNLGAILTSCAPRASAKTGFTRPSR
jgi:hypothetical protein